MSLNCCSFYNNGWQGYLFHENPWRFFAILWWRGIWFKITVSPQLLRLKNCDYPPFLAFVYYDFNLKVFVLSALLAMALDKIIGCCLCCKMHILPPYNIGFRYSSSQCKNRVTLRTETNAWKDRKSVV